jgi:transcriptional regulator with XRE-family HTH domain
MRIHKQNKALRELREIRGFSQEQLAKECGLGIHSVLRVEKGYAEGSIHFWRDIQLIFNIPDEAMWSLINGDYNIFKYRSAVADHAYDRGYADGFKAGKEATNE